MPGACASPAATLGACDDDLRAGDPPRDRGELSRQPLSGGGDLQLERFPPLAEQLARGDGGALPDAAVHCAGGAVDNFGGVEGASVRKSLLAAPLAVMVLLRQFKRIRWQFLLCMW